MLKENIDQNFANANKASRKELLEQYKRKKACNEGKTSTKAIEKSVSKTIGINRVSCYQPAEIQIRDSAKQTKEKISVHSKREKNEADNDKLSNTRTSKSLKKIKPDSSSTEFQISSVEVRVKIEEGEQLARIAGIEVGRKFLEELPNEPGMSTIRKQALYWLSRIRLEKEYGDKEQGKAIFEEAIEHVPPHSAAGKAMSLAYVKFCKEFNINQNMDTSSPATNISKRQQVKVLADENAKTTIIGGEKNTEDSLPRNQHHPTFDNADEFTKSSDFNYKGENIVSSHNENYDMELTTLLGLDDSTVVDEGSVGENLLKISNDSDRRNRRNTQGERQVLQHKRNVVQFKENEVTNHFTQRKRRSLTPHFSRNKALPLSSQNDLYDDDDVVDDDSEFHQTVSHQNRTTTKEKGAITIEVEPVVIKDQQQGGRRTVDFSSKPVETSRTSSYRNKRVGRVHFDSTAHETLHREIIYKEGEGEGRGDDFQDCKRRKGTPKHPVGSDNLEQDEIAEEDVYGHFFAAISDYGTPVRRSRRLSGTPTSLLVANY